MSINLEETPPLKQAPENKEHCKDEHVARGKSEDSVELTATVNAHHAAPREEVGHEIKP